MNYFELYCAYFRIFVICTLPTQGSIRINFQMIKKQVIRPEKWDFFQIAIKPGKIVFSQKMKGQ